MKKCIVFTILMVVTGLNISCENEGQPEPNVGPKQIEISAETRQLIDSDNKFGFELMQKIAESQDEAKNTMISPVSVSLALAMTYNGAAGETKKAMEETLHLNGLSTEQINESYKSLMESLLSVDEKVTMEIANSIWYREEFQVEQDFIDVNEKYYDAGVSALDFDNPEAVDIINNWVAEKTHNKIPEIIEKIDPLDVMFLINALYFNGKWKYQFDEEKTTEEPFYLEDGSEIQTDMMVTETDLRYHRNDLFQAVELPYGRGNYSMVCFLPSNDHQPDDIIAAMNNENWDQWMENLDTTGIEMHLPKFKFEYKKKLNEMLKLLGIEEAFNPDESDFSGINPDRKDLHISEVLHKTFVEVDEKGTEAAAVTSVTMGITSIGGGGPMVLRFDRPFVFAIREVTTNTIVFMGKLEDPYKSS
ncbi:MAG: serpin family protein [Bacteroidota bacterium]